MRIKRLKLTGFKSFVEPSELRIESGLTGIVGPNGCGKSNLLEAIRWVMGEGSAKSLRGAGMEDVIFAGTASRPARDFAEVTIRAERDAGDTAPGLASNDDAPELEVTRRIERGAGSAYRANGRDVRAKDVALIFADAATGAHSPALVSQGRIGAIIAAKPQERRQMLEEAAGISGLHVRRKDAEQKLRAAESNLSRLAVILSDMDARAGQLRRQAKQAERYRKLTTEITQAEARLIFIRWKEAKTAADIAKAEAMQADNNVAAATSVQQSLNDAQQLAIKMLASDRAAAMMTRDAASDVSNTLVQLSGERDRIFQRQTDLQAQAARMQEDSNRESKATHDAADALNRLQEDSTRLNEDIKSAEEARPALNRVYQDAELQSRTGEIALANAAAQQARADAEQQVAQAAVRSAQARYGRVQNEYMRLKEEQSALGNKAELEHICASMLAAVATLQTRISANNAAIATAETLRTGLITARDTAQSAASAAKAELSALAAEKNALERALIKGSGDSAINQIKAVPGYERAVAAALGEDANAAIGGDNGRRWIQITPPEPAMPHATDRLSAYVTCPPELTLRFDSVIVAQIDDGRALARGERIVTLDGHMRRWDGFAAQDDGAQSAQQLIRANRLAQLADDIPIAEAALSGHAETVAQLLGNIGAAQEHQRALSAQAQAAENELRQALRDADKAEDALTRLNAGTLAMDARMETMQEEVKAGSADVAAVKAALDAIPGGAHHNALVEKLTQGGNAARQALMQAQADMSSLDRRIAHLRERRAVATAEIRSWQERAGDAARRIAQMHKRTAEIAAELAAIAGQPDTLSTQIASVEQSRAAIAEKLAALQSAEQSSEAALKTLEAQVSVAGEAAAAAREQRAGAQARAENQELRRVEMGRVSGERFECPPPVLPEKMGFDEADLESAPAESARLDRLQLDRERIGPVNLIAADELTELETEQAKGTAGSAELNEAVGRLRGSIGSLNREGRIRLRAAFEAVDGHFRRLFTTLFNGGAAHLELIDSDDPLEAGLEIMAQPPGKKLASLTLLSGGEQALTAVALIFGLFLTNPAPICVLDEVDAPLDDANIERFCDLLDVMTRETDTRYLIVTHNAVTMSRMHRLFGVTMAEQGVSRLVSVDLGGAEELLAADPA